ncbi:tyrosine-type recombinase/integrase [Clostridium sp.]
MDFVRHTYAVKLINFGVDIFSVQELLAHSSPEMTNNYVKLMDDTKRKEFEKALEIGAFRFDSNSCSHENIFGKDRNEILNMLWTNYKLDAIDTPYGICLQRVNCKCNYAKNPPCLTCNSGSSCRDLSEGDSYDCY